MTPEDADTAAQETEYELGTLESIRELGAPAFRDLLGESVVPPFLYFEWFDALERAGCVTPERGWLPQYLVIRARDARGTRVVALAPAFVKGHSDGEFVFDHSWAQFAETRLGIDYYPKLIVAVPFTPATAPKVLVAPGEDPRRLRLAFCRAAPAIAEELNLSSVHVLFSPDDEARALEEFGFAYRAGVQFHWQNRGYTTFDDFLGCFSSKKRHQIRRERRALDEQGTRIRVHTGADLDEELARLAYQFYLSTVDKYVWGRRYLNQDFFNRIFSTMPERVHLVVAYDAGDGRPLAGAFNLLGDETLYGRYWGCLEDRPFLHFNVCFYAGIEECISRGLTRFEPGAGGEHKLARGFEPAITHSAHYLRDDRLDQAVRAFLEQETEGVDRFIERSRAAPLLRHPS